MASIGTAFSSLSTWHLCALSDAELAKVDLATMNLIVAREIPGLESICVEKYLGLIDEWSQRITRNLPQKEQVFHRAPDNWKGDIRFFRLGCVAEFMDLELGVRYVEEHARSEIESRKLGVPPPPVFYTDPGQLFLHGLIDTRRGTCGNMPVLLAAIGQRLGWPTSIAVVKSHNVCRYDDGELIYNIESTTAGYGGFGELGDKEHLEKGIVSPTAVACGSDLTTLSPRQVLGVFVALRGRHYRDIEKWELSDRDYCLARTLFPQSRRIYLESVDLFLQRGQCLFDHHEIGHPVSLGIHLAQIYPVVHRSVAAST